MLATDDEMRRYQRALSRGAAQIDRTLSVLDRERLASTPTHFEHALEYDLIDAGDFAAHSSSE